MVENPIIVAKNDVRASNPSRRVTTREDVDYEQNATRQKIMATVLDSVVLSRPREDVDSETMREMQVALKGLGIDYEVLQGLSGIDLYNSRFDVSLYGTVLMAYRAAKILRFDDPAIYDFDKEYIHYLLANPDVLMQLRTSWTATVNDTGILTTLSPLRGNGSIPEQISAYLNGGTEVDVYSEENRYPLLFDNLIEILTGQQLVEGTIVEFGTAACDNLYFLREYSRRQIGFDVHSLERIITHPMTNEFRWKNNTESSNRHLNKIKGSGIEFVQGSMFDTSLVSATLVDTARPLVGMYLNVLFHFHSDKIAEALDVILAHNPDLLVIGGALPGLGQMKGGEVVAGIHSRVFDLRNNKVEVLAHTVDIRKAQT